MAKRKKSQAFLEAQKEYQRALKLYRQRLRRLKAEGYDVIDKYKPPEIQTASSLKKKTQQLIKLDYKKLLGKKEFSKRKKQQKDRIKKPISRPPKPPKPPKPSKPPSLPQSPEESDNTERDRIINNALTRLESLTDPQNREFTETNKIILIDVFQSEMVKDPDGLADRLEREAGMLNNIFDKAFYAYLPKEPTTDSIQKYIAALEPFFRVVTGRKISMSDLYSFGII